MNLSLVEHCQWYHDGYCRADASLADVAAYVSDLEHCTHLYVKSVQYLRERLEKAESALIEIRDIAAPAWKDCPSDNGWYEVFGDIAGIAEEVVGL